jgi:hypothetical protein
MNMPTTYKYAQMMYEKLRDKSRTVEASELVQYGYPASETGKVKIYTDFIYKIAKELGFSTSQQNTSMNLLKAMRCVDLIKHGGRLGDAVYILHYYPTDEKLLEFKETSTKLGMKIVPRKDELYTRDIAELRLRVQKLEEQVGELLESGRFDIR